MGIETAYPNEKMRYLGLGCTFFIFFFVFFCLYFVFGILIFNEALTFEGWGGLKLNK